MPDSTTTHPGNRATPATPPLAPSAPATLATLRGPARKASLVLPVFGKPRTAGEVDVGRLQAELEAAVEGDVRFDAGHRAMYSVDASHYRHVPFGVVMPKTKHDVVRVLEVCRSHGVPIVGRGGGTSLAGNTSTVGVVLDFSRHMNRVLEIDAEKKLARVEPGCVLDDLRALTHPMGLTFGPDPSTHSRCTFGGMIGNNACGVHSVLAQWHTGARTSDNLHRLEVVTYDGARFWTGPTDEDELRSVIDAGGRRAEIYQALRDLRDDCAQDVREGFPDIPRRVSGYNIDDLLPEKGFHVARALTGSESTCAVTLEAEVHLVPWPKGRALVVVGYKDVHEAADDVPLLLGSRPMALEGLDARIVSYNKEKRITEEAGRLFPAGGGYLLVELGGESRQEAVEQARALASALGANGSRVVETRTFDDPRDEAIVWEVRESGLGATALNRDLGKTWEGWEDSSVSPARLGEYSRELTALMKEYGYDGAFYGHFGQGLIHVRINFDLGSRAGVAKYLRFLREATDLVVSLGGSVSGEHGDGQARGVLLSRMFNPPLMRAFRRFKEIWDPEWRMNPGRILDPYLPSENMAVDPTWKPPEVETYFGFPKDGGAFFNATERCVGVGKCRRKSGGTMCPSYMVTREEEHSTRGRARALFEMMRGDVITDGWQSEEVHHALDLCLGCKGCKRECPVNVDMATYKAEFNAHYYEGRLRPRRAYAFGWIWWWARAASLAPGLVNWLGRTEPFATAAKAAAGVHPARRLPTFAPQTFRQWFRQDAEARGAQGAASGTPASPRAANAATRGQVVFWPDTFSDHFHPQSALAAVRALRALGFEVLLPPAPICCGRPLYDYGFLGMAKRLLARVLATLDQGGLANLPVVGIEPSCIATFRDELPNLFPRDKRAERLAKRTFLLGEFLDARVTDADLGRVEARALLHGHCHHKAVLDLNADQRVLTRLGVDFRTLDSGCCGMAGPFGFEKAHYDVAQACGERVLLPAVRGRDPGTLIVTEGFSCKMMIDQNVKGVSPVSLGELVWRGLSARSGR